MATAADFDGLWKKARTSVDGANSIETLAQILSSKDGGTFILDLGPQDAELCIKILDHGLANHMLHPPEKQAFFCTLIELSAKHSQLPKSMAITDEIIFSDCRQSPISGGFADIKPGKYKGRTVAVKTLRLSVTDNPKKIRKQFCKEAILWNSLSHPNILKLVGVLSDMEEHRFATVSEWMVHGHIMGYIRKNATNRLELLHGAGKGLKYLHDANLIHGDIKGANILITSDTPPVACLADFGFTTMVPDPQNLTSQILELEGGTMTFMAPELLTPSSYGLQSAAPTREADVYAFGLVIFQVLTGEQPFRGTNPRELAYDVLCGAHPDKPANAEAIGISDSLWELIEKCWDSERTQRPRIQEVMMGVGDAAADWHTDMPPSNVHWEVSDVEDTKGASDELKHAGIFQSYESEGTPAVSSSTAGTSQSGDASTISIRPTKVETHEEPTFKHSNQKNPLLPTSLPPQRRKGFRYFLKQVSAIFRRKLKWH